MKPAVFPVIPGRRHARRLGFRTLNFELSDGCPRTPYGIYAGWIWIGNERYRAAIHYGPRPFLNDPTPSLEAHLIETTLPYPPIEASFELIKRLRVIRSFLSERELRAQIKRDVEQVKRMLPLRVYVFGVFDGVHLGHRSFLRQARKYGEFLTAVIARDHNVSLVKGHQPKRPEEQRRRELERLNLADRVILGDASDPYGSLKTEPIDVICLGYDQAPTDRKLRELLVEAGKAHVRAIRLKPFLPFLFHSQILSRFPWLLR